MITIEDIAREAGVSATTVSNVIHGRTNKVSSYTVELINEIIRERGYVPNLSARAMKTRSSKVVALMVQKGLIEQQSVPGDRRVRRLTLTPRAEEVKRMMDEDHEKFEATLRRGLSEEELATLFSLLDRLQENLRGMDVKEGTEKA